MQYIIGVIVILWLRRQLVLYRINKQIDKSCSIIENCEYERNNTPWWQRTQYYINGVEVESSDYWKNYHKRRLSRLITLLDSKYKYSNLCMLYIRKFYRITIKSFNKLTPKFV